MRWLKLGLAAAWLAAHAWLWTLLPPVPRWTVPGFAPHSFAFTPDGRSLVTCDPAEVGVWDAATGRRVRSWPRRGVRPGYDNARSLLVPSPTDRRAIVYDIRTGGWGRPDLIDLDTGRAAVLPGWENLVPDDDPCIGFLPDGRTAWQLDVPDPRMSVVLRLWELPDGPVRGIPIEGRLYEPLSVSADGRRVVAHLHRGNPVPATVLVLDLAAGRLAHKLVFDRQVLGAALSPDGRTVAVTVCLTHEGSRIGGTEVELWDAETGRRLGPAGEGFAPGWNAADQLVIVDGGPGVRPSQGPGGAAVVRWPIPRDHFPFDAILSPGGRFVLDEHTRYLPDPVRRLFERLPGRPFDPDKRTFVQTVYDARTGRPLAAVGADQSGTAALAADGTALAVGERTGFRVWDVPPRKPGGIVLALLIGEVIALIGWTACRRRRVVPT